MAEEAIKKNNWNCCSFEPSVKLHFYNRQLQQHKAEEETSLNIEQVGLKPNLASKDSSNTRVY